MTRIVLRIAFCGLVLFAGAALRADAQDVGGVTCLSLLTGPNTTWGSNRTFYLTPPATTFQTDQYSITGSTYVDSLYFFTWGSGGNNWSVVFDTAGMNSPLSPGVYRDFNYLASNPAGKPRFLIAGRGIGGQVNSGSFTIYEAVFDLTQGQPKTKRFAASLEGFQGPWSAPGQLAIRGTIAYNSLSPMVPEPGTLLFLAVGALPLLATRRRRVNRD